MVNLQNSSLAGGDGQVIRYRRIEHYVELVQKRGWSQSAHLSYDPNEWQASLNLNGIRGLSRASMEICRIDRGVRGCGIFVFSKMF